MREPQWESPNEFASTLLCGGPPGCNRPLPGQVLNFMDHHWHCTEASIVISITGSAQELDLKQRLETAFKRGLAQAALATQAMIVTGGTDTGVMALVGKGLAEYNALTAANCIGIASWGVTNGRDKLAGVQDETVQMPGDMEATRRGANLEPNHTHFLLVDTGVEGEKAWGHEIKFRALLEAEFCARKRVPRVLVVVQVPLHPTRPSTPPVPPSHPICASRCRRCAEATGPCPARSQQRRTAPSSVISASRLLCADSAPMRACCVPTGVRRRAAQAR